jgi:S-adenosylmethionine/arginine decarboxylase-like enzyme
MYRGQHAILDITGFVCDYTEGCDIVHNLMRESVSLGKCRIVAEQKVLYDGTQSPPGFSSFFVLDASHISSHCYSSEEDGGLVSIDAFTCGDSNPSLMIDFIHNELLKLYPNIKTTKRYRLNRFALTPDNPTPQYNETVVFNT